MTVVVDLVAGTAAGLVSTFAVHPLDTIRVRSQTAQHFRSSWQCARTIVQQEGCLALYKGLSVPLAAQGLYKAVVFSIFGAVNARLSRSTDHELLPSFAAGVIAGAVNASLVTPVELVRNRLQVSETKRTSMSVLRAVVQNEGGARRLFSELPVTALRDGLGLGCYFVAFKQLRKQEFGPLAAGAWAGIAFWTVAVPLDCVKNVLQVAPPGQYAGVWDCATRLVQAEGVGRLFRGTAAAFGRGAPSAAITLSVHGSLSEWMHQNGWG